MKINFKKIIHQLNPKNPDVSKIDPIRDWKGMVFFFAFLALLMAGADGYFIWKSLHIVDENIILEEQPVKLVNKAALNSAIEKIKAREEQFKKKANILVKDPSI